MTEKTPPQKILLIRMLGLGDVTCIGIPAIRFVKSRFPEAEITILTFSAGKEVISLAEPDVKIMGLDKGEWPDNIVPAMETFMGLAEIIVGEGFDQIINLDTWFMPCFLARFLKDTGEPVEGNWMSKSLTEFLDEFQKQTLKAEYVNDPAEYIQSSFFGMQRWHTAWWEYGSSPLLGYPEFYLRTCCGFSDIQMDFTINVPKNERFEKISTRKKIIALATDARTEERNYPHGAKLAELLKKAGFEVWSGFDGSVPMKKTLSKLKSSHLLVSVPSAPQWLAAAVGTPTLIISGTVDPRTLMPEYATDPSETPIAPEDLVASIKSVFTEQPAVNG